MFLKLGISHFPVPTDLGVESEETPVDRSLACVSCMIVSTWSHCPLVDSPNALFIVSLCDSLSESSSSCMLSTLATAFRCRKVSEGGLTASAIPGTGSFECFPMQGTRSRDVLLPLEWSDVICASILMFGGTFKPSKLGGFRWDPGLPSDLDRAATVCGLRITPSVLARSEREGSFLTGPFDLDGPIIFRVLVIFEVLS